MNEICASKEDVSRIVLQLLICNIFAGHISFTGQLVNNKSFLIGFLYLNNQSVNVVQMKTEPPILIMF